MEIDVKVENLYMRVDTRQKHLVSGTQRFIKFNFNLSDDWEGLLIFAQFIQNGQAYNKYLDSSYGVFLPPEIEPGACDVILYGTGNDGSGNVIATTNCLKLIINDNHMLTGTSSTDITPSLYEQLVTTVTEFINSIATVNEVKSYLDI